MPRPDFFIIGAAKAGTSTLYQHLKSHPVIFMSPVKEPNYFSTDIEPARFCATYRKNTFLNTEQYFADTPLKALQLTFVRKPTHYYKLFEEAKAEQITGEASTSYLYSEVAAHHIYRYNPDAKLIAILRNPIMRAFSHYLMALKYGHVHTDFYNALQNDIQRDTKGWGRSELFIELGLYYHQLKRYFNLFPKEQILILLFDELIQAPRQTLARCQRFLEVKEQPVTIDFVANEGSAPRAARINKLLVDTGIKHFVKSLIPKSLQQVSKKALYTQKRPQIPEKAKALLLDYYREDIRQTSALIGRDLSHWMIDG